VKQAAGARDAPRRGNRLANRARRGIKAAVVARGTDVTEASAGRSCLVVAPHPDDETLGCGVTIMRKMDAGTPVKVVIATDGRRSSDSRVISPDRLVEIRRAEALVAAERLGLDPSGVVFLDLEDQALEENVTELADRLAAVVDDFRPEEILVSSALDHHPDHRAVSHAVRRLLASGAAACPVAEYPMGFWRSMPFPVRPRPRGAAKPLVAWAFASGLVATVRELRPDLIRTDGYLDRKRHVLDAYASQLTNLTGEPEWWTLDEPFLAHFLGRYEVLLPITRR
jgi:LmbE family N-acetylglucosaminyl deacetylase